MTSVDLDPGVAKRLHGDGLTLSELFEAHITHHPQTYEVFGYANGCTFDNMEHVCDCEDALYGDLTRLNPYWPVSLGAYDLVFEWLDADGKRLGCKSPADKLDAFDHLATYDEHGRGVENRDFNLIKRAEAILRDRFAVLIDYLRSGDLVARGQRMDLDNLQVISRAIWASRDLRIDFPANQLHRLSRVEIDSSGPYPFRAERTTFEWGGVLVCWCEGKNNNGNHRGGGRPPKYKWDLAYQELVFMLFEGVNCKSKTELSGLFVDAFIRLKLKEIPDDKYAGQELQKRNPKLWSRCTD